MSLAIRHIPRPLR